MALPVTRPQPVEGVRMRLQMRHEPPGHEERQHTDRDVDEEDPLPPSGVDEHAAEDRPDEGRDPGHGDSDPMHAFVPPCVLEHMATFVVNFKSDVDDIAIRQLITTWISLPLSFTTGVTTKVLKLMKVEENEKNGKCTDAYSYYLCIHL